MLKFIKSLKTSCRRNSSHNNRPVMSGAENNNGDETDAKATAGIPNNDQIDAHESDVAGDAIAAGTCGRLNCHPNNPFYPMYNFPKGKCVIINIERFDERQNLAARPGSSIDGDNVRECFKELGFQVYEYRDDKCTAANIRVILSSFANEDYTDYDCFALFIMTHGDRGSLRAYDRDIRVEELFIPFQKSPTLHGKPKLFFIQACRGKYLDAGHLMQDVTDTPSYFRIPTWADFLIAYSTVEGYYSWRHVQKGSWFLQALVSVIREKSHCDDLMTMFAEINRKVSYEFTSNNPKDEDYHNRKQVPCVSSMLTRLLYFNLPDDSRQNSQSQD